MTSMTLYPPHPSGFDNTSDYVNSALLSKNNSYGTTKQIIINGISNLEKLVRYKKESVGCS